MLGFSISYSTRSQSRICRRVSRCWRVISITRADGRFRLARIESLGWAMGKDSMRNPTGESASSFMWGRYRQLCHHMSGELRTANRYGSEEAMKKVLLFPYCPAVSRA